MIKQISLTIEVDNEKWCSKCGYVYPKTAEFFKKWCKLFETDIDIDNNRELPIRCKSCLDLFNNDKIKEGEQWYGKKEV